MLAPQRQRRAARGVLRAFVALGVAACSAAPMAATIMVAPGQSLAAALRRAADGDQIHILAGDHHGQVGVITQKQLTLRGVGGRPVLHADGQHAEGKAILVVRDGDIQIENIEFRGTRVADGNGAGIRFERGRLTVVRCGFFDNQMGLLTGNVGTAELSISESEFGHAPAHHGALPHLLYVGSIGRFTLTGSRLSGGSDGHLVKSRARENHIRYNHLVDGPGGQASYELEFPNGGLAFVVGNVIGQSRGTRNSTLVAFGAEGSDDRAHGLYLVNNTLINDGLQPAIFVRVHQSKLKQAVEQRLVNNLFVGLGVADLAWGDLALGNFVAAASMLQDAAGGRFGLASDSSLRGRGVAPGSARGIALQALAEFMPPAGTRALAPRSHWSPGAYQD